MGYHLTMLRTTGAASTPISEADVRAALPAMGGRLAAVGGSAPIELVDPGRGDTSAILIHDAGAGELWSSTPDPEFVALMLELAGLLGARVRGDEYETYRTPDQTYPHPDDAAALALQAAGMARRGRRWTIWHGRALVLGGLLAVLAFQQAWKILSHQ
jgi:hypothetical protein